ncbi:MAG: hypothetical protein GWP08_20430 [Nitrospiraceae bacterium]|nr:hypothetical protein [Nitrospiraceae bacterium]
MRITHPFHPLFGREYEFVICRLNWGEERAYYRDEEGNLVCIPAHWTNVIPPDPVVELSGGRSWFRVADLLALVKLLRTLEIEEEGA